MRIEIDLDRDRKLDQPLTMPIDYLSLTFLHLNRHYDDFANNAQTKIFMIQLTFSHFSHFAFSPKFQFFENFQDFFKILIFI